MTTFVLPTRNESESISAVIHDACQHLSDAGVTTETEILIVDDSDDLATVTAALDTDVSLPNVTVNTWHRTDAERDGLTGAIFGGISRAQHDRIIVMDGDGQHPLPAALDMLDKLNSGVELVFASRYLLRGGDRGLSNAVRRFASRTLNHWLRAPFHGRTNCTDPLTGFFALDRNVVTVPLGGRGGWKAAYLILALNSGKVRYEEVGYMMNSRVAGQSKLGLLNTIRILNELVRARSSLLRARPF